MIIDTRNCFHGKQKNAYYFHLYCKKNIILQFIIPQKSFSYIKLLSKSFSYIKLLSINELIHQFFRQNELLTGITIALLRRFNAFYEILTFDWLDDVIQCSVQLFSIRLITS